MNDSITGPPRWVDFHCHVDLYPDHEELIRECDAHEIATLAITTTPKAFERNQELADRSRRVVVGLGLHPQLVAQRAGEIRLFEQLLPRTSYVGEIGLDAGKKFYASFDEQQRVFDRILRACDEQGDKILSLHSVRSVARVLKAVELCLRGGRCVPIMHWFTGTKSEAKRAAELGAFFSVNLEMLSSPRLWPVIRSFPLDRILTETDGPFVQLYDRPSRPTDIPHTVETLASLWELSTEAMAKQIVMNLDRIAKRNVRRI